MTDFHPYVACSQGEQATLVLVPLSCCFQGLRETLEPWPKLQTSDWGRVASGFLSPAGQCWTVAPRCPLLFPAQLIRIPLPSPRCPGAHYTRLGTCAMRGGKRETDRELMQLHRRHMSTVLAAAPSTCHLPWFQPVSSRQGRLN